MTEKKAKIFKKGGKQRQGRGFSVEELKKAKLGLKEARKLGIHTDPRRKTAHDQNVETIKSFLQSKTTKPKPKKKSKS
jgi:large subunit ribosomal protein L13e